MRKSLGIQERIYKLNNKVIPYTLDKQTTGGKSSEDELAACSL